MKNIQLLIITYCVINIGCNMTKQPNVEPQGLNVLAAINNQKAQQKAAMDSELIQATQSNDLARVKKALASKNVDINQIGEKTQITAIMHAVMNNNKEMIQLLLNHGANPHIRLNWSSNTALRIAAEKQYKVIFKLLLDAKVDTAHAQLSKIGALIEAVKNSDAEIARQLLENGVDVNQSSRLNAEKSDSWSTALFLAVCQKDKNMAQLLLQHKADPNNQDNTLERTALMMAVNNNDKEMVQLLRKHGADPDRADIYGNTAKKIAHSKGNKSIIQLLESK